MHLRGAVESISPLGDPQPGTDSGLDSAPRHQGSDNSALSGAAEVGDVVAKDSGTQVVRPRLTLFYYRPMVHVYHGQTRYVTALLDELRSQGATTVIAPAEAPGRVEKNAYLGMLRNMLVTQVSQFLHFAKVRRNGSPDEIMVIVDAYSGLLPLFWNHLSPCPLVYVASDPAALYARSLKSSGIPGSLLLRTLRAPVERQLVKRSRLVVVRSRWMLDRLVESGCPSEKLRVLPHPPHVEPPNLTSISAVQHSIDLVGKVAVIFLGDFEYPPNRESADFLQKSVLPMLSMRAPNSRLLFAGPGSEQYRNGAPLNLLALGLVKDLSPVLYACAIGIAPATVAGGTSAKTIDYLAHGLVCLVTPEVARSLDPDPNLHVSSRERFAEELVSLVVESEPPRASSAYFERRLKNREVPSGFGRVGRLVVDEIRSLVRGQREPNRPS